MARASFVVSMGPLRQTTKPQGQPEEAALRKWYDITTFTMDGNMDLEEIVRFHVVVEASDPKDVREFVEEMYGNVLTEEIRHALDRQLA